jgi:hypothetical protein|uniref:Uncharacterized protein n=1 Tax=Siphoviridae sp. ctaDn21 TaxID=2825563 RepID=A0A8S5UV80_9CAUD|nr:MAG TPA: hypothetical protein [Siphoviridae sp. ctaDn21]
MERIKTLFHVIYANGTHLEVAALFDTIDDYDDTVEAIEGYIDNPQLYDQRCLRLTPYNADINGDVIATDIVLRLDDIIYVEAACETIKYEEPIA